ncbi:hypothetical protein CUR178_04574 [Leishmania enriettii]|uniref:Uncharacterized protein n=1 Tax=Leishmania enriettii TaxID=5663 RepID=A0A836GIA5_LEIEN|nr:hypothetical protein CUR178_00630 [Leishmania enriettii]KAG5475123.1 hypothetical protein CUR178_04574 [Leishmania enriettii]
MMRGGRATAGTAAHINRSGAEKLNIAIHGDEVGATNGVFACGSGGCPPPRGGVREQTCVRLGAASMEQRAPDQRERLTESPLLCRPIVSHL